MSLIHHAELRTGFGGHGHRGGRSRRFLLVPMNAEFGCGTLEDFGGVLGQGNIPSAGNGVEYPKRPPCT